MPMTAASRLITIITLSEVWVPFMVAREDVPADLVLAERVVADGEPAAAEPRGHAQRRARRRSDGVGGRSGPTSTSREAEDPDRGVGEHATRASTISADHRAAVTEEPPPDDLALREALDLPELDRVLDVSARVDPVGGPSGVLMRVSSSGSGHRTLDVAHAATRIRGSSTA